LQYCTDCKAHENADDGETYRRSDCGQMRA
jgi:hypothetical protein